MSADTTFRPAVVLPTFNNARTLDAVLAAVQARSLPIFVVNDGSTDRTRDILATWTGRATVMHHDHNRGKAAALLSGFDAARAAGFSHAATIDTDGQHDAADLPALLAAARDHPRALILGARAFRIDRYPGKNRLGRRLSNLAIRLESGARVSDSQCGLRVYPLDLLATVRPAAGRFGFESEIITRATWAGRTIIERPVRCTYALGEERVSHFRPVADSARAVLMHAMLLLASLRRR